MSTDKKDYGGQFAQIKKGIRRIMTPFLYLAIKSLYWTKGGSLKKILWCDDKEIKPYFIAAMLESVMDENKIPELPFVRPSNCTER